MAIRWPNSLTAIVSRFEAMSVILGVVDVVYTEHVPIVTPKKNVGKYYNHYLTEQNQKASYLVIVHECLHWSPGSLPDAVVLERSALHVPVRGWVARAWIPSPVATSTVTGTNVMPNRMRRRHPSPF